MPPRSARWKLYDVSALCVKGDVTTRTAKNVVKAAFEGGAGVHVAAAVEENGGMVIKDMSELRSICKKVVGNGVYVSQLEEWQGGDKKLR